MLPLHYTEQEVRQTICNPSHPYLQLFEDWLSLYVDKQRLEERLKRLERPSNIGGATSDSDFDAE